MNKKLKFLVLLLFAVLMAGCNDDAGDPFVPQSVEDFELSSKLSRCVHIIDPWKGDVAVPINNDFDASDIKGEGKYLEYSVEQGVDKKYLVLKLKDSSVTTAFMEKMMLGDTQHYFVCQYSANAGSASSLPSYLNMIGHSVSVTDELLSDPIAPCLNFEQLYADGCVVRTAKSEAIGAEISGSKYTETVSKMSESMSVSATVPVKGGLLSGSFSQSFSKEEISSDKYEYYVNIYRKVFADCHLTPKFTVDELDADRYMPYISKEANELLNDTASVLYKRFGNDEEGITKLYDTYGTHVLTGGVFGGAYIYVFGRKQTASFRSTANAAGASLSWKSAGSGDNDKNALQTYFRVMAAVGASISASGEDYNSEEEEVTKAKSFFVVKGGNASENFESWDNSLSSSDSNLSLVAYGAGENQSYMIPLYFLAKEEKRRNAMKEYFDDYFTTKEVIMNEVAPMVIADFKMKTTDSQGDIPNQMIAVGPDNKTKLIYYPLILNKNFDNVEDRGKAVNTANHNFLSVAQGGAQVWWYALEYADECNPITDIRFYESGEVSGYEARGENAETTMHWPAIDDHYVSLKFTEFDQNKEKHSDYIRGVGLEFKNSIIATSAGTDMIPPYVDMTQYDRYWSNEADYTVGADESKPSDQSWFGDNNAVGHKNLIFPVFTKKDLIMPITVQEAMPY